MSFCITHVSRTNSWLHHQVSCKQSPDCLSSWLVLQAKGEAQEGEEEQELLALPAAGEGAELEAEIDAAIASAEMAGYAKVLRHQNWGSSI